MPPWVSRAGAKDPPPRAQTAMKVTFEQPVPAGEREAKEKRNGTNALDDALSSASDALSASTQSSRVQRRVDKFGT
jgi:hypothetical protein